jgi:polar amino acid transport system substrate-binding protein
MSSKILLSAFGILFTILSSQSAIAHSVLEKVVKTGVLTAGTSKDAFPFAYADKQGRLTGYSIDMLEQIKNQVEKEVKRPVKLELVALNPDERIPKLRNGTIDIVCDAASFTWERDLDVDYWHSLTSPKRQAFWGGSLLGRSKNRCFSQNNQ